MTEPPISTTIGAPCGTSSDLIGKFSVIDITAWDNNKIDGHLAANGKIIDSASGEKIGSFSLNHRLNLQPIDGLPITTQSNAKITCEGSGEVVNLHLGITIDETGNVHFRS